MRKRAVRRCIALGALESIQHTTPDFLYRRSRASVGALGWLAVAAFALITLAMASNGA
ncbi:hypothetical protein [Pseudoxanthomonas sp. JBR18]|uniref:hypothetical protein n=1 Tax=Pseudoxanthomonas sp. JBR18 TaxID=2969308 RepID=UPI0023061CE2|nr:hypothetical protein [Pseudoxanthomonas sp. JBR18]WCE02818.1 hypothetical protein PJ250_11755 [Pseudoxanthomonas sp. JBR18]